MLRFLALLWMRFKLAFASFYTYIKGKFPPKYPEASKAKPSKPDVTAPPAPSTPVAPISDSEPFDITKLYDPNGPVAEEIRRCFVIQEQLAVGEVPKAYFSNHLLQTL